MLRTPKDEDELGETRRQMGALVRMPPRPHEDIKLGKPRKQDSGKASKAKKKPASEPGFRVRG
jgi:hypothetical protein